MSKFWELLEESVLFQGMLVLMVFGSICFLVVQGREVPKEMWGFAGVIVGFFFGAKGRVSERKTTKTVIEALGGKDGNVKGN